MFYFHLEGDGEGKKPLVLSCKSFAEKTGFVHCPLSSMSSPLEALLCFRGFIEMNYLTFISLQ